MAQPAVARRAETRRRGDEDEMPNTEPASHQPRLSSDDQSSDRRPPIKGNLDRATQARWVKSLARLDLRLVSRRTAISLLRRDGPLLFQSALFRRARRTRRPSAFRRLRRGRDERLESRQARSDVATLLAMGVASDDEITVACQTRTQLIEQSRPNPLGKAC